MQAAQCVVRCMESEKMENLKANSRLAQLGIDEILNLVTESEELPYLIHTVLFWVWGSNDPTVSHLTPHAGGIARRFQRVVRDAVKIIFSNFTLNADIAPIQKNIEL